MSCGEAGPVPVDLGDLVTEQVGQVESWSWGVSMSDGCSGLMQLQAEKGNLPALLPSRS